MSKRAELECSLLVKPFDSQYHSATPISQNRFSFRPLSVSTDYLAWPALTELCDEPPSNGLMEKRRGALIDIDRGALEHRMQLYFNKNVTWEELSSIGTSLTKPAAGHNPKSCRNRLLNEETFRPDHVVRYAIRPFDTRWAYYCAVGTLWNSSRPLLWKQYRRGNEFIVSRPGRVAYAEGLPVYYTKSLGDNDFQKGHAYYFPILLHKNNQDINMPHRQEEQIVENGHFSQDDIMSANLSGEARAYLNHLGFGDPDSDADTAALIWFHVLAITYAPVYLAFHVDGLRINWPHVPLPKVEGDLLRSAEYGRTVSSLLDPESEVPSRMGEVLQLCSQHNAVISRIDGMPLIPEKGDLAVTVGWGHFGKNNAVMPGRGRAVSRAYTDAERAAIRGCSTTLDMGIDSALSLLGEETLDIWLNDRTYWRNVPRRVWDFRIGGFQVIKKWLSYREQSVLGRALDAEEVHEVSDMVRRIAALLLLEPALNSNYQSILDNGVWAWKRPEPAILIPKEKPLEKGEKVAVGGNRSAEPGSRSKQAH